LSWIGYQKFLLAEQNENGILSALNLAFSPQEKEPHSPVLVLRMILRQSSRRYFRARSLK
jgi:hypothetical protein